MEIEREVDNTSGNNIEMVCGLTSVFMPFPITIRYNAQNPQGIFGSHQEDAISNPNRRFL